MTVTETNGPVTEHERLRAHEAARLEAEAAPSKPKRRRRGGLSIQSKLLIMLLAVSVVSATIVGLKSISSHVLPRVIQAAHSPAASAPPTS